MPKLSPVDPESVRSALDAIAAVAGGQTYESGQGPLGQLQEMIESLTVALANADESDPMEFQAILYNRLAAFVTIGSAL